MSELIVAGTGHRPNKLIVAGRPAYDGAALGELIAFAMKVLDYKRPSLVISGMALGWDIALAAAAYQLEIPYDAYVPFTGQESKWPLDSQKRYDFYLENARRVVICSPGGYSPSKMQIRNERMVDACDELLALWNGTAGGTANCVEYARKRDVKIVNCWRSWLRHIVGARAYP